MPGADDLLMRIYAAMAQKERELISERIRAALGGDRGYRPASGPDTAAADAALARALNEKEVPTPRGGSAWTHTTIAGAGVGGFLKASIGPPSWAESGP